VLDNEVELREARRRVVHVTDIERVLVQRPDRRPLVDVDVLDAELLTLLQEDLGLGILQRPAARAVVPLGGVELHALEVVLLGVLLELPESGLALTRIPASVGDQPSRVLLRQRGVSLQGVEPVPVPGLQVRGLEDADVRVAVLEDVPDEVLLRVLLELLDRPVRLFWTESHVGVEALDPALRVLLLAGHPVRRARIPKVDVAINDEVALAVLLVHLDLPQATVGWSSQGTPRGAI